MDVDKEYKKLRIQLDIQIKHLEIQLERQEFYKAVVDEGKIKDTKRQIEAYKLKRQAVEKQIPKAVVASTCPSCTAIFPSKECIARHCSNCGQSLQV